jgi:hypothetical protein
MFFLYLFSSSSPNLHTENGQPKEALDFPTSKACWEDFDLQINAFTAHHDCRNVRLSHLESLLIDACSGAQNTLRFSHRLIDALIPNTDLNVLWCAEYVPNHCLENVFTTTTRGEPHHTHAHTILTYSHYCFHYCALVSQSTLIYNRPNPYFLMTQSVPFTFLC